MVLLRFLIFLVCVSAIGVVTLYSFKFASYSSITKQSSLFTIKPKQSRLCACLNCLKDGNPMFRAAVDAAPVPFLSKDFSMSSDDFKRWKRMQSEQRNMTVFKMVVDKLFQIIPPVPQYEEVSPKRCNTCAVVGNSGNLKGSHYGDLIDSHDIVIRMNRGHTKGYEEDVGTKTTHHVMYPESATNLANTTRLVFFAFKINDLEWLLRTMTPENKNSPKRANKDLVMIINPAFMIYAHKVWLQSKGHYPSTGFFTVILSLQMCDVVNVFGFGADRAGNWNHYFEKVGNIKTGPHPGNDESKVIEHLAQLHKIKIFKGV